MNASLGRTPISGAAHSISYDNLEDKNEVIAITYTFLLVRASVAPFLAPTRGALAAFAGLAHDGPSLGFEETARQVFIDYGRAYVNGDQGKAPQGAF
jgi:hypothetical protein